MAKYKSFILYAAALALLLFLLKWLQWKFIIIDLSIEIYIGLIAIIFTILGIWIAQKLTRPSIKTIVIEKPVYGAPSEEFVLDENALSRLSLSKRELDVLELMARGLSNEEIAAQLYISLSTIKSHCSRIFEKMDVKRRTQAIEKAKRLKIIP